MIILLLLEKVPNYYYYYNLLLTNLTLFLYDLNDIPLNLSF
jgi:hypothetical protein